MTLLDRIADRRAYLDANVFIYGVEGVEPYFGLVAPLLRTVVHGSRDAVPSEITLSECLVGPYKRHDKAVERAFYDTLRPRGGLTVAPVTRAVLVGAAQLRARHRALKLPDAVHAATARQSGCAVLVTNDDRLAVPDVEVLRLAEVVGGRG